MCFSREFCGQIRQFCLLTLPYTEKRHPLDKTIRCKYIEFFLSSMPQILANCSQIDSLYSDNVGPHAICKGKVLVCANNSTLWPVEPLFMLPQHEEIDWGYG